MVGLVFVLWFLVMPTIIAWAWMAATGEIDLPSLPSPKNRVLKSVGGDSKLAEIINTHRALKPDQRIDGLEDYVRAWYKANGSYSEHRAKKKHSDDTRMSPYQRNYLYKRGAIVDVDSCDDCKELYDIGVAVARVKLENELTEKANILSNSNPTAILERLELERSISEQVRRELT